MTRRSAKSLANDRLYGRGVRYAKLGKGCSVPIRYAASDVAAFMRRHRAEIDE